MRGSAEPPAGTAPRGDSHWDRAGGCGLPRAPQQHPCSRVNQGQLQPGLPFPSSLALTPAWDINGGGFISTRSLPGGARPEGRRSLLTGGSPRREAGNRPQRSLPLRAGGGRLCPPLARPRPCGALPSERGRKAAARPGLLALAVQLRSPAPATPGLHPTAPAGREAPPPPVSPPPPGLAARQHRPLPATETHLQAGQGQGEDEREDHAEIHPDFRPRRLRAHGRRAPGGKRFPQRAPRPPGLRHRGRRAFPFPLRAGLLVRELQEPLEEEVVVVVVRGGRSNSR